MWKNQKKQWSLEEEEYLLEHFGTKSILALQKELQRSAESIKQKYYQLMGQREMSVSGGYLTPSEIAPILGVSRRTINHWIRHQGLKARQFHGPKEKAHVSGYRFFIDPMDLWKFLHDHPGLVNYKLIQRGVLLPEPDWFEAARKAAPTLKPKKNWTKEEDALAYRLWKEGTSLKDIAIRLQRPYQATYQRLTRLKKKQEIM